MSKILVVDDDHALVDTMQEVLEAHGHKVVTAISGKDGFAAAKKEQPSLILLDVMMEHDNTGFEIAKSLHGEPQTRGIPVIIITGVRKAKSLPFKYEPDEDWLPVKAVLEKPVQPEVLLNAIDMALKK